LGVYGCLLRSRGDGLARFGVFQQGFTGRAILEITAEPTSITAQILKAKYYPHTTILGATLGT
jgi:hypothetical protein